MLRIDLHTHSQDSPDGSITSEQYVHIFENGILDYIAITDHDSIKFATNLQKSLGDKIIVGEEITTSQGEIIGLFLNEVIRPGMSAADTVKAIKSQRGLVYIPHPFETVRKGISKQTLESIIDDVDIIETYNGRAFFQNKGPEAATMARISNIPGTASSDAHGMKGLGTAYANIEKEPTAANLPKQLQTAKLSMQRPPLKTLLYPKINRIKKGLKRG